MVKRDPSTRGRLHSKEDTPSTRLKSMSAKRKKRVRASQERNGRGDRQKSVTKEGGTLPKGGR